MTAFRMPALVKTRDGAMRRVGFELEFSGITLDDSISILERITGTRSEPENAFASAVKCDTFGTFHAEIDAALLRDHKYREYLSAVGIELEDLGFEKELDEFLKNIAGTVVPCEIVTPPLPMTNMDIVEEIVKQLRKEKAEGTSASIVYAFGLHMNPELATQEADYLLSHIRSFALLYDWIGDQSEIDITRKLTPYIDPYPTEYLQLIMEEGYKPSITTLIDDYMEIVTTRNQALDMLPAFANINRDLVMSKAAEPDLVKPRPAFHYRLANCLIDVPEWQVASEWDYWLKIESLANNISLQQELVAGFREHLSAVLPIGKSSWLKQVGKSLAKL